MSMYVNLANNEPLTSYFNEEDVRCIYFNGEFVWGEKEPWNYQQLLDTIEKKKNGEISKWPSEYDVGNKFVVELNNTSEYWGDSVEIMVSKHKANSLVFSVLGNSCYWFDPNNIANYKGWFNCLPREHCQELYELLPFKDNLVAHTIPKLSTISSCGGYNSTNKALNISMGNTKYDVVDYVVVPAQEEYLGQSQMADDEVYNILTDRSLWIRPKDKDSRGDNLQVYHLRNYSYNSYRDLVLSGTYGNFTTKRFKFEGFFEIG